MAYLALVRHGQSEWNLRGLWTGLTDISLTKVGIKEARHAGVLLKKRNITFNSAYISNLIRTQQTLNEILTVLKVKIPIKKSDALNEKDYGDLTGKNKWQIEKEVGQEEFLKIRRSWDYRLPHGESLKDVYDRVVPYYKNTILPQLQKEKNVIVVSHGNTLRALIKYLDDISDDQIPFFEIVTGEIHLYYIDTTGKVMTKEVLQEANKTRK